MKQHIWDPLGITDMTFFLSKRRGLRARIADMSVRSPDKITVEHSTDQPASRPGMVDALGGQGIFASPAGFMKVLQALLLATDPEASDEAVQPERLLRRSTAESMFSPQLGEESRAGLRAVLQIPLYNQVMGAMPAEARKDWGLGGLLVLDDLPGWRRNGTMWWGGAPNLSWVSVSMLCLTWTCLLIDGSGLIARLDYVVCLQRRLCRQATRRRLNCSKLLRELCIRDIMLR